MKRLESSLAHGPGVGVRWLRNRFKADKRENSSTRYSLTLDQRIIAPHLQGEGPIAFIVYCDFWGVNTMLPTSRVSGSHGGSVAKLPDSPRSQISALQRGLLTTATLMVILSGFTGCMTMHNGFKAMTSNGSWNDTVVVLRNRSFSSKAWHRRKHHFCDEKFNKDFCAGFRAGYEASADGSDGCTPAFPPKEYWSWEFQSAEGQGRTAAWFAGYPYGAQAAEEDGVSNWNQLPMGANMQAQYPQQRAIAYEGEVIPIVPDPGAPGLGTVQPLHMGLPTEAQPLPSSGIFGLPPGAEIIDMP